MKIAVVGAGAMGRWAVKELGHQRRCRRDRGRRLQRGPGPRGRRRPRRRQGQRRCFVDARDQESVQAAIAGCDAMVNATQHFWNITVMHAAAAAGVHYTDMGGLFHVTKQQVELDEEFKRAGVTAVIAMGGAPGVTNILAKYGADRLDTVEEAHALCGNVDDTDWSGYDGWVVAVLAGDALRRVQRRRRPSSSTAHWDDGHHRRRGAGGASTSASRPACSRRTTPSTPSPSPSGTPGRTRASGRRPSSWRCRRSSPARCAS